MFIQEVVVNSDSRCSYGRYPKISPPPTHTLGALRRTALTLKSFSAMKTTQDNYVDFYAQHFFSLLGTADVKFTFKKVTVDGATVPLIHIDGKNLNDASRINIDFWPYRNATKSDLEKLPASCVDFVYRIGYATVIEADTATGELKQVTKTSNPKVIGYYDKDGNLVEFSGKKHVYDEATGKYEPWENVDDLPKPEEEKKEEPKVEEKPEEKPAE